MKERIERYFAKMGWNWSENGPVLKISVDGAEISWSMFIKADEEESFCSFSVLPTRVPEKKLDLVSKLTNVFNSELWFGNFELILNGAECGQLRFRTSSFVPKMMDENEIETIIEKNISFNMAAMNRYAPMFMKAIFGSSDDISEFYMTEDI